MYPLSRSSSPILPTPAATSNVPFPYLSVPYEYVALAIEVLAEHDLDIIETDRLRLTVHLALESVAGFHASALYDLSDEELDEHFIDFVVRSVRRRPMREAA
jgi:hypothetical protein